MEPSIRDGDDAVFRADPRGARNGLIVLAQYRGEADPDTGGSFTVKRYSSEKIPAEDGDWRHARIVLSPINREYRPIVLGQADAMHVKVLAQFIALLRGSELG